MGSHSFFCLLSASWTTDPHVTIISEVDPSCWSGIVLLNHHTSPVYLLSVRSITALVNFALLRRGSKPVWKPRSMQTLGWWVSSLFPRLSPLNRESLGKRLVSVISVYWNSSCLWILILMLGLYIVSETDPLPQKKKTHFSSFVEVGLACETCLYTWHFEMESKFIFLLNSKGAIYKLVFPKITFWR